MPLKAGQGSSIILLWPSQAPQTAIVQLTEQRITPLVVDRPDWIFSGGQVGKCFVVFEGHKRRVCLGIGNSSGSKQDFGGGTCQFD